MSGRGRDSGRRVTPGGAIPREPRGVVRPTLLLLAGLAAGPAAVAGELQGRDAVYASGGPRRAVYAVCDRAAVRSCQADAKLHVQFCEAFPGRLACVDRALTELQMCWAATGCF